MKITHPTEKLDFVLNDLIRESVKHEILPRFAILENRIAYELESTRKSFKGLIYEWGCSPDFVYDEIRTPYFWDYFGKQIVNPYVCCEEAYVNITNNYIEAFCLHSSYIHDEILSFII